MYIENWMQYRCGSRTDEQSGARRRRRGASQA